MKIEDYDCDLEMQRFFRNRWKTKTGKIVLEQLLDGIKIAVKSEGF